MHADFSISFSCFSSPLFCLSFVFALRSDPSARCCGVGKSRGNQLEFRKKTFASRPLHRTICPAFLRRIFIGNRMNVLSQLIILYISHISYLYCYDNFSGDINFTGYSEVSFSFRSQIFPQKERIYIFLNIWYCMVKTAGDGPGGPLMVLSLK